MVNFKLGHEQIDIFDNLPDWVRAWSCEGLIEATGIAGWLSFSTSSSDSELKDGPVWGIVGGRIFADEKGEIDDIFF